MLSFRRPILTCAGLLGLALVALADDATVMLTTDGTAAGEVRDLDVRPNTKQPFFIVIKNTSQIPQTFVVEIEGLKGTPLRVREELPQLAVNESKTISLKPPPPKKDEPAKPEAKKDAEDAAPKGEPPTGVPLKVADLNEGKKDTKVRNGFGFKIRVLKLEGKDYKPATDKDRTVSITILKPAAYVDEPVVNLEGETGRRGLAASVTAKSVKAVPMEPKPEVNLVPPAEVAMLFPPQLALSATELRAGTYRRALSRTGQTVELSATNLPLTGDAAPVKFSLTVDGYPRSFAYSLNSRREISAVKANNKVERDREPAVRLLPMDNSAKSKVLSSRVVSGTLENPRFATLPAKALRFRVEVDNEPTDSVLLLRVDRSGQRNFVDPDESINLGLPKDEKVWLDVANPEGGLLVTNAVADRVEGVDISALRGPHELQAVLQYSEAGKLIEKKFVYNLVVDETPPPADDIHTGPFPKRHERGKPLPYFVTASDPDTLIERVRVYVGKPGPEGKFPPEAVFVDAVQTPLGWVAQVPLPAPAPAPPAPPGAPPVKKDPMPPVDTTVVVQNEVGLTTYKLVRIELVDPKGATLEVRVERGGRPQPGAAVTLRDVDGKEKATGTTDPKGVVKFDGLAPGVYKLASVKEDTSYGLAASVSVTIPDPPPVKAIPVLIPLAKRR
jgi:Prealbumin-like fold domain